MASAAFVPGYSGGTATDSHRLPYSLAQTTSLTSTHVEGHRTDPGKEFNRTLHPAPAQCPFDAWQKVDWDQWRLAAPVLQQFP